MKLVTDEQKYIVYLYKKQEIPDFKNKEKLEEYFRNLFLLLNENYDLDICGYYNLYVFLDSFYGKEQQNVIHFDNTHRVLCRKQHREQAGEAGKGTEIFHEQI